jgi:two-component system cell cycle sensor histidine kinase/response regulator CckA
MVDQPLRAARVRSLPKQGVPITIAANTRTECSEFGGIEETTVGSTSIERASEDQLRKMLKMQSLALLAGGIAHDFNNILTGVLGLGELVLQRLDEGDPRRTGVQKIVDAAIQGRSLTGQLLAFSRDEALPIYPLNLDAEINQMRDMLRRLIGEHIAVQLCLGCESQKILAERGAIFQVVLNLCVNARDAMPWGGRLTVRTFSVDVQPGDQGHAGVRHGSYVALEVADTGCGMDKALQERIFEPFFTTKLSGKGNAGLGLYTVCEIVHRCSGHILVQSEMGRGSTLRAYFPVVRDSLVTEPATLNDSSMNSGKELILVVEDDDTVREMLRSQLEDCGYLVLCEASPAAAIRDSQGLGREFKLLLTDVVMPELNGPDLARLLKRKRRNLKVLYMTGWAPADILPAAALGKGSELLRKPFTTRELNSTIRHLLG